MVVVVATGEPASQMGQRCFVASAAFTPCQGGDAHTALAEDFWQAANRASVVGSAVVVALLRWGSGV